MASKFALLPPQPFETTAELLAEVGLSEGQTAMAADDTTLIWIWLPFLVEEGGADTGWFEFASSARATKWQLSTGPPSDADGNENDLDLDLVTGTVYLKTAGTWGRQFTGVYGVYDPFLFDSDTTAAQPAAGYFRLVTAGDQDAATSYVFNTTNELGITHHLGQAEITDTLIRISLATDPSVYLSFRFIGTVAHAGWREYSIQVVESSSSNPFAADDPVIVSWLRVGGLIQHQAGTPASGFGFNGDWCVRESDGAWFKKTSGSWDLIAAPLTAAVSQSQPSDPTGIAAASGEKMLGLAGSITPNGTQVEFQVSGSYTNTNAGNDTDLQLRYGTGTAPTNGAAPTGTAIGSKPRLRNAAIANYGFALQAIVTGLTPGTAYWFDLACTASSGTSTVKQVSMTAKDIL